MVKHQHEYLYRWHVSWNHDMYDKFCILLWNFHLFCPRCHTRFCSLYMMKILLFVYKIHLQVILSTCKMVFITLKLLETKSLIFSQYTMVHYSIHTGLPHVLSKIIINYTLHNVCVQNVCWVSTDYFYRQWAGPREHPSTVKPNSCKK